MAGTTVIIGLGNPLLSDDGVGIHVLRRLAVSLAARPEVATAELYAGGMRLIEAMAGHARAILVDAMVTGSEPGAVATFSPGDLQGTQHVGCSHDLDLPTALAFGRGLGLPLPAEVAIWGVEAFDLSTFGEDLTPAVAAVVPQVAAAILDQLEGERRRSG